MTEMLTPHFSVKEFLVTSHRALVDVQAKSWAEHEFIRKNAQRTCVMLERIREMVGPLRITSGYRCGELNDAVGGRPTSRHMLGLAADVQPIDLDNRTAMRRIVDALKVGALQEIDEAILEMNWLHLQIVPPGLVPRRLVLMTSDGIHFEGFA